MLGENECVLRCTIRCCGPLSGHSDTGQHEEMDGGAWVGGEITDVCDPHNITAWTRTILSHFYDKRQRCVTIAGIRATHIDCEEVLQEGHDVTLKSLG